MAQVLQGLPGVVCYIDDILVTSHTRAQHKKHLRSVLDRLHIQGYMRVHKATQSYMGYTGLHIGTEGYIGVHRVRYGYTGLHKAIHCYTLGLHRVT